MRTTEPECADRPAQDWGVYLYCFARPSVAGQVASPGVDSGPEPERQREAVTELVIEDIAAVFSPVRLDAFRGPAGDAHLRDMSWLVPRARQHEQVVEEVMQISPVLPARFGTVLSSAAILKAAMLRNTEQIRLFLERATDREEWSVKAFLDVPKAQACLLATEVAADKSSDPSSLSPGRRYIQAQQRRANVRREVDNYGRQVAAQIEQLLAHHTVEMRTLPAPSPGQAALEGRIILNCALLVPKTSVAQWHAALGARAATYADQGVHLCISGPWPPYSFCPSVLDSEPAG